MNELPVNTQVMKEDLALRVVDLAKARVLAENHFLSAAIGRLSVAPSQLESEFSTDGYFLMFDADRVIAHFKRSGEAPKFNLLHSVVHCLFLHPYVGASVDQPLWNLACDVAVERVMADLMGPRPGQRGVRAGLELDRIERDMGCRISAERVYSRLREGWWASEVPQWMDLFRCDAHDAWYAPAHGGDAGEGEGSGRGTEAKGGIGRAEGPGDSVDAQAGANGTDAQHGAEAREGTHGGECAQGAAPGKASASGRAVGSDVSAGGSGASNRSGSEWNVERGSGSAHLRKRDRIELEAGDGGFAAADAGDSGSAGAESGAEAGDDVEEGPHASAGSNAADGANGLPDVAGRLQDRATQNAERSRQWGTDAGDAAVSVSATRGGAELRTVAMPSRERQQAEWRQVATSLAVSLQTARTRRANALAALAQDLQAAAQPRMDYARFLRQFATMGEVMRVSQDEFDNVFYTYGLALYGDVPLVEPLEYREQRRVREFAIVIDTSGSVQGNVVRSFAETTFDILRSTESFFERVNLRILQCDAQVRTDDRIINLRDLREWGSTMTVVGGGGTDFRPAFEYVDALVAEGAFRNLGGLLYFTDGHGTYPDWTPAYKCAFVFHDDDYRPEDVPPWAMQVVFDQAASPRGWER